MSSAKLDELIQKCNTLFNTIKSKLDSKLDKTANAVSASKLAAPFTFTTTGDAVGSAQVPGNANVSLALALKDIGVVAGSYGTSTNVPVITVDSKGRITNIVVQAVPTASTTVAGLTKLSSALDSTATDTAASSAALKTVNDSLTQAKNTLANKLDANGTAVKANALAVPFNLSLVGAATGSVSIAGNVDVNLTVSLKDLGLTAGAFGSSAQIPIITIDKTGLVTGVTAQDIRTASETQTGVVQLSSALDSTSKATAATSFAVKQLADQVAKGSGLNKIIKEFTLAAGAAQTFAVGTDIPGATDGRAVVAVLKVLDPNNANTYINSESVATVASKTGGITITNNYSQSLSFYLILVA